MPNRRLYYKRAEFVRYDGTLEAALAQLNSRMPAKAARQYADSTLEPDGDDDGSDSGEEHRTETTGQSESTTLLSWMKYLTWPLDDRTDSEPYLCGHALRYTPGVGAPFFDMNDPSPDVKLESLKDKLAEGTNIPECQTCFLVRGNHVIVMPGGSLTAGQLSAYLQRLLWDAAIFAPHSILSLRDYHNSRGSGRLVGVQSLTLNIPGRKAADVLPAATDTGRHGTIVTKITQEIAKYIASYSGESGTREARQHGRLNFKLKIGFETGIRAANGSVLDDFMSAIPENMFPYLSADIAGIGDVKGNKLQLFRKRNIQYNDGVPDQRDVAMKMAEFLLTLKQLRKIPHD